MDCNSAPNKIFHKTANARGPAWRSEKHFSVSEKWSTDSLMAPQAFPEQLSHVRPSGARVSRAQESGKSHKGDIRGHARSHMRTSTSSVTPSTPAQGCSPFSSLANERLFESPDPAFNQVTSTRKTKYNGKWKRLKIEI